MNKEELVARIAEIAEITKVDAKRVLDASLEAITEALVKGDEVRLLGFGSFKTVKKPATQGRNPRTGAVIKIKASKRIKFTPGKGIKDRVNK